LGDTKKRRKTKRDRVGKTGRQFSEIRSRRGKKKEEKGTEKMFVLKQFLENGKVCVCVCVGWG
jgi:hypothetical protein